MRYTAIRKPSDASRKPTNVSLDVALVEEARGLGINISRACEEGLQRQVAKDRAERWREDNHEAIECWNAYVEEHGLPLARHRTF